MARPEQEVAELKGSFQWIAGQFADVQKFMHAHFEQFEREVADFRSESRGRFDKVEADIRGLRNDLPGIVGNAVRDVLAERR